MPLEGPEVAGSYTGILILMTSEPQKLWLSGQGLLGAHLPAVVQQVAQALLALAPQTAILRPKVGTAAKIALAATFIQTHLKLPLGMPRQTLVTEPTLPQAAREKMCRCPNTAGVMGVELGVVKIHHQVRLWQVVQDSSVAAAELALCSPLLATGYSPAVGVADQLTEHLAQVPMVLSVYGA